MSRQCDKQVQNGDDVFGMDRFYAPFVACALLQAENLEGDLCTMETA